MVGRTSDRQCYEMTPHARYLSCKMSSHEKKAEVFSCILMGFEMVDQLHPLVVLGDFLQSVISTSLSLMLKSWTPKLYCFDLSPWTFFSPTVASSMALGIFQKISTRSHLSVFGVAIHLRDGLSEYTRLTPHPSHRKQSYQQERRRDQCEISHHKQHATFIEFVEFLCQRSSLVES